MIFAGVDRTANRCCNTEVVVKLYSANISYHWLFIINSTTKYRLYMIPSMLCCVMKYTFIHFKYSGLGLCKEKEKTSSTHGWENGPWAQIWKWFLGLCKGLPDWCLISSLFLAILCLLLVVKMCYCVKVNPECKILWLQYAHISSAQKTKFVGCQVCVCVNDNWFYCL